VTMESLDLPVSAELSFNKQGQTLRRKGRLTRQRFLDETFALLHSASLEEVTVPNIAAKVGMSTATFYLYFSDIDELHLELAEHAGNDLQKLLDLIETPWPLDRNFEYSLRFVQGFLDVVRRHRPVIHLRNARADRNDKRFDTVRIKSATSLINALGRQLHRIEDDSRSLEVDFSLSVGAALFTGLERLSVRLCGPDEALEDTEILIHAQAQIIADCISAAARSRSEGRPNLPGRN
jgi:AcrR family transcriptional regulator